MSWLPTYYGTTFNLELELVGFYCLIPMPILVSVLYISGASADKLAFHNILSLKTVRRIFQSLSLGLPAIAFFVLGLIDLPLLATTVCITISFASLGLGAGGKDANFIDLSPKYTSSLFAFANVVGSLPGIVGVYLTGWILEETRDNWSVMFLLTGGMCVVAVILWVIFLRTDPIDFDCKEDDYLLEKKEQRV